MLEVDHISQEVFLEAHARALELTTDLTREANLVRILAENILANMPQDATRTAQDQEQLEVALREIILAKDTGGNGWKNGLEFVVKYPRAAVQALRASLIKALHFPDLTAEA